MVAWWVFGPKRFGFQVEFWRRQGGAPRTDHHGATVGTYSTPKGNQKDKDGIVLSRIKISNLYPVPYHDDLLMIPLPSKSVNAKKLCQVAFEAGPGAGAELNHLNVI